MLFSELRDLSGKPLQYPCLENPMNRGAWWAEVHGVTKSPAWLSAWHLHFPKNCLEMKNYLSKAEGMILMSPEAGHLEDTQGIFDDEEGDMTTVSFPDKNFIYLLRDSGWKQSEGYSPLYKKGSLSGRTQAKRIWCLLNYFTFPLSYSLKFKTLCAFTLLLASNLNFRILAATFLFPNSLSHFSSSFSPSSCYPHNHQQTFIEHLTYQPLSLHASSLSFFFSLCPPWGTDTFVSILQLKFTEESVISQWIVLIVHTLSIFKKYWQAPVWNSMLRRSSKHYWSLHSQFCIHLNLKALLAIILTVKISRYHERARNGESSNSWEHTTNINSYTRI